MDSEIKSYTIENEYLKVEVSTLGAELLSVVNKETGYEYIWQGAEGYWSRHSPLLFPNVGRTYNDIIRIGTETYKTSQHGFARDENFELDYIKDTSLLMHLSSNERTKEVYPFDFTLLITYVLDGNLLAIMWEVVNLSEADMYFTIGGHPAFNTLPNKSEYSLIFPGKDKINYHLLDTSNGCAKEEIHTLELDNSFLPLSNKLFEKDALIIDDNQVKNVGLVHGNELILSIGSQSFPNFGIWSNGSAPFVCLEPWMGRADNVGFDDDISKKPGIIKLEQNGYFNCFYGMEFFKYPNIVEN